MLLFTVSFGWENRDNSIDDWLKPFAIAMFVSALTVVAGAVFRRGIVAALGYVASVLVSLPGLRYALVDMSDHADGKLVAFAALVAATGAFAVYLTSKAGREAVERQPGRVAR